MSGYRDCACRDCFDIAIGDRDLDGFCWACREAGCEGDTECSRDDAYGMDDYSQCDECGTSVASGSLCRDCDGRLRADDAAMDAWKERYRR